jgi:hypothetical protein
VLLLHKQLYINYMMQLHHALYCCCCLRRAMDKAEKEDRMKRAEQKRKDEENKRRCATTAYTLCGSEHNVFSAVQSKARQRMRCFVQRSL